MLVGVGSAAAQKCARSSGAARPRTTTHFIDLARPLSTTNVTSSMVMEVSAMLVARMIFHAPAGGRLKTARCFSVGMPEWSGRTWNFDALPKVADVSRRPLRVEISPHPGRKTSTAPISNDELTMYSRVASMRP